MPEPLKTTESIVEIPLVAIVADRKWNVRKFLGDDGDGIGEHEFSDLVNSLKLRGQDTPVIVRPISEVVLSTSPQFSLIAGFRRFAAFERIYNENSTVPGITKGCIQAVIRDMPDAQAKALNGRENIGRNALNMADKSYLIHELSDEHGMNYNQISEELALSLPYVRRLHQLYKRTCSLRYVDKDRDMSVFDHWREAPGRVPYNKMLEIVDFEGSDRTRESMYRDKLQNNEPVAAGKPSGVSSRKVYGREAGISELGRLLGKLESAGVITVHADAGKILEASGKGRKSGNLYRLCEIFSEGFSKGKGT